MKILLKIDPATSVPFSSKKCSTLPLSSVFVRSLWNMTLAIVARTPDFTSAEVIPTERSALITNLVPFEYSITVPAFAVNTTAP